MNTILLIFLALPLATVIISIALQKILKSPILVSAITFVVFLIIALIFNNFGLLVAAIAYGILSFLTAYIACILCKISSERASNCNNGCNDNCNCNEIENALPSGNNGNSGCMCRNYRRRR